MQSQPKPKCLPLSRSLKKLGRVVGRGNRASIANTVLADPTLRFAVLAKVVWLIRKEMKTLCSLKIVSAYRDTSFHSLLSFSWDRLVADLALHAPILHTIVSGCVPQRGDDSRCNAVIGMVVTVLLKSRNRSMCAVQTVFSLILNEGHTNKQVITGTHIIYYLLLAIVRSFFFVSFDRCTTGCRR